jgi:hypothetical protein
MVWSEQEGVSIVLPSDRVDGDGRNYIVIGEDVPAAISDQFTAALVFRNGAAYGEDPLPGTNIDTNGTFGGLYPNGFVYYALGISKAGALELVTFYFVVPSPRAESYQTFRRTLLSIAAPVGVDKPPVLSLGSTAAFYESYLEGVSRTITDFLFPAQVDDSQKDGVLPTLSAGVSQWTSSTSDEYQALRYWLSPDGMVHVNGLVNITNAAALVAGSNATLRICLHSGVYAPAPKSSPMGGGTTMIWGSHNGQARTIDVKADGLYLRTDSLGAPVNQWLAVNGTWRSSARSWI